MLTIRFESEWGQSPEDFMVSVFNGYGAVVHARQPALHQVDVDVPDGLHIVRVEGIGGMREQSVQVTGSTSIAMKLPELYSPTPIRGAKTSHEYYEGPSAALSAPDAQTTSDPIGESTAASAELLIVIRASNRELAPKGDLADGLLITDLSGRPLRRVGLDNCQRTKEGFQGFRAETEPGSYWLVYPQEPRRALLIQTFAGRQTQVFATFAQRPVIEEAGIFLPTKGEGFQPFDDENRAADLAIRGLINNQDWLPKNAMQTLLYGKFRNPMLGLLGAFILIRRQDPNIPVLGMVLDNLNYLLPGSADVQVLLQLFSDAAPGALLPAAPDPVLKTPPMLRVAMESAIRISWKQHDYLAPGLMVERVAPDLYADSAWTSWRPVDGWEIDGPRLKAPAAVAAWVEKTIWEQIKVAKERKDSIDAGAIAQHMGLPTATVDAVLAHMN